MSGSNTINVAGDYGTQGVAAPTNVPGAREFAVSWTDTAGTFWLFGGAASATGNIALLNDLWKFDGTNWIWVSGSNQINAAGSYGTQGTPAAENVPAARQSAVSWIDAGNNLWLFGGIGLTNGIKGQLNDLWKFDGTNWTWISGSNVINAEGSGTQGVPAPGNTPGARFGAFSWTDKSGLFWLFGGFGPIGGVPVHLNDLWKFDGTTWTWVTGNVTNAPGVYGTQGVPADTNSPGARREGVAWADTSGNGWLFGGFGFASGGVGFLNDLWKFDGGTNWTWLLGSPGVNVSGTYGTPNVAAAGNTPGARGASVASTDLNGHFWLFGGVGIANGGTGLLNDLWKFDGTNWAWVSGSNGINLADSHGTQGVADPANAPGGREGAVSWTDKSGNLWLFGGLGSAGGLNNDLWRYQP